MSLKSHSHKNFVHINIITYIKPQTIGKSFLVKECQKNSHWCNEIPREYHQCPYFKKEGRYVDIQECVINMRKFFMCLSLLHRVQLPWALSRIVSGPAISTSDTSPGNRGPLVLLGVSLCIPPTPSIFESPTYQKIKLLQAYVTSIILKTSVNKQTHTT